MGQTADVIRDPTDETAPPRTLAESAREAFGRLVATGIFYFTKVRIKSILSQVYEFEVDDDLVRSIELAAEDPGAIGTFYQLSLAGGRTKRAAGDLLEKYEGPLMLLWGERDPWMTPSKASRRSGTAGQSAVGYTAYEWACHEKNTLFQVTSPVKSIIVLVVRE